MPRSSAEPETREELLDSLEARAQAMVDTEVVPSSLPCLFHPVLVAVFTRLAHTCGYAHASMQTIKIPIQSWNANNPDERPAVNNLGNMP